MASVLQSFGKYRPITKSDTVNFPDGVCDAIYVGTAGVVVVVMENGDICPFTAVAGGILPVRAKRVNDTDTVPTLMVALYQV
jgi:hypothetical protein